MKKTEALYLLLVLVFAVTFVAATVSQVRQTWSRSSEASEHQAGAAGKAREVDMEALKRSLSHGFLSEREAEYYERLPEAHSKNEKWRKRDKLKEAAPRKGTGE